MVERFSVNEKNLMLLQEITSWERRRKKNLVFIEIIIRCESQEYLLKSLENRISYIKKIVILKFLVGLLTGKN